MIRTFYHPDFAAPIGQHIMPMRKFSLVAQELSSHPHVEILSPRQIEIDDLLEVHTAEYIEAVRTGEPLALAQSQKFPWSPALFPSVLLTNGGIFAAAEEALESGSSAALASGFHHSHRTRGEGFCTFNGLVVAIDALRKRGKLKNAAILDMDLHYGNGTAQLTQERPWIFALSLYGNDYWDNTAYRDVTIPRHRDGRNHRSAALPAGCNGKTLFEIMEQNLPLLLESGKPDLLLYQAGADPYCEDPYSPLSLTHSDLLERDRLVFQFAKRNQIPIAWVLAGGYTQEISKVVQVHVNTFQAWKDTYDQ